jgi:hypothetical protein
VHILDLYSDTPLPSPPFLRASPLPRVSFPFPSPSSSTYTSPLISSLLDVYHLFLPSVRFISLIWLNASERGVSQTLEPLSCSGLVLSLSVWLPLSIHLLSSSEPWLRNMLRFVFPSTVPSQGNGKTDNRLDLPRSLQGMLGKKGQ